LLARGVADDTDCSSFAVCHHFCESFDRLLPKTFWEQNTFGEVDLLATERAFRAWTIDESFVHIVTLEVLELNGDGKLLHARSLESLLRIM